MKTAYVFDMDGTLADSMTVGWGGMPIAFLRERNLEYPNDLISRVIALGMHGMVDYLKTHFEFRETHEETYEWFVSRMRGLYETSISAKPYAKEYLLDLRAQGASLHVLTGSPHAFLDPWLRQSGLGELFDNAWSSDDFSKPKSDAELYAEIAQKLGVAPASCVMVDDSLAPLVAAKKAGWQTLGIYDEFSKENEPIMRNVADRYAMNFKELL